MNDSPGARWLPTWRQLTRLPVHDLRFWFLQILVIGLAAGHLLLDILSAEPGTIPAGIPVALLLAPVSYAAFRYGLSGAAATAVWATLLWLPDLFLPGNRGHAGNDLIELALVIAVAAFVGYHIDGERLEHARAERASGEHQAAEARYRQLFDTNSAPILVACQSGKIVDANPAALALVTGDLAGRSAAEVLGHSASAFGSSGGSVIAIPAPDSGLRYFRVHAAPIPPEPGEEPLTQLVLLEVTQERAEGQRVQRFAELLLQVQEEERRRIAQELHDEPLQLLVQLARSLERLGTTPQSPDALAEGLAGARSETLGIADRLRAVVAGLRPAALEQLGLAPALRGFLADVADSATVRTELQVSGIERRLPAEVELGAFRIAQEAVNNVIRHADARQVLLTLTFAEDEICLRVADDGRGFDTAALDRQLPAAHLGVLGMRERAALAGGRLTIRSKPGEGTIVEAGFSSARLAADAAGHPFPDVADRLGGIRPPPP